MNMSKTCSRDAGEYHGAPSATVEVREAWYSHVSSIPLSRVKGGIQCTREAKTLMYHSLGTPVFIRSFPKRVADGVSMIDPNAR